MKFDKIVLMIMTCHMSTSTTNGSMLMENRRFHNNKTSKQQNFIWIHVNGNWKIEYSIIIKPVNNRFYNMSTIKQN